jgi:hypothetical protein
MKRVSGPSAKPPDPTDEGALAIKFLQHRNDLIRSFDWSRLLEISVDHEADRSGSRIGFHADLENHLSKVVARIRSLCQNFLKEVEPDSFARFQWETIVVRTLKNLSSHLTLSFIEDALTKEKNPIPDNGHDLLDDHDPSEEEIQQAYEDQMWLAERNERGWSHIEGRVKDYINLIVQILKELEQEWSGGSRLENASPIVPLRWQGEAQVLAWLLLELAEKNWIAVQRHRSSHGNVKEGAINASAFARSVLPHFENIKLGTFEQVFKDGGTSVPLKKWQGFKIPERTS